MLYITRKKGESIIINNDITITIVEVNGNKVKLGCNFPENATILRSELHEKISEINKTAATDFGGLEDLSDLNKNNESTNESES
jgi:carbon storage regulator